MCIYTFIFLKFFLFSFDCSWRLFDVDYETEVLFQEGHSKPVFHADFQIDGSLILTV